MKNNLEKHVSLKEDQIHLWVLKFSEYPFDKIQYEKLLDDSEIERMNNFKFDKDKKTYAITRSTLRVLLSRYIDIEPTDVTFYCNDYGKPFLGNANKDIQFNVSHSGNYGLIAITEKSPVGVDIEKINPDFASIEIAKKYYSQTENELLNNENSKDKIKVFFNIWSRKEAYIKCFGEGLSIPLNEFSISTDSNNPTILNYHKKSEYGFLYNLDIDPSYSSALMVLGKEKRIKIFKL